MRLSPTDRLSPELTELLERTLGPAAQPPPPILMRAHNVQVGYWTEGLGAYCRNESRFPPRLRVLSMLIAGRHFDCPPMSERAL